MARRLEQDGGVYRRRDTNFWWMRYRDRTGILRKESTGVRDWQAAQKKLRERLQARDGNILDIVRKGESLNFGQWADFFLENYSKPPIREPKTHAANLRATLHLKRAFAARRLFDVTADDIELFLRERLCQRVRTKTTNGYNDRGTIKPATVHQELRVLRRMLNVAVRKKLLPSNPCSSVEFPVAIKRLFKPHYVTWSEQQRIERHSPHACATSCASSRRQACGSIRNFCPCGRTNWTLPMPPSGFRIPKRRMAWRRFRSLRLPWMRFEANFLLLDRATGCFRVREQSVSTANP